MSDAPTSEPEVRLSLRTKLLTLAILLVTLPLIGVGLRLVDINADTVETTNRELQIAVAQDIQGSVDGTFASAEDALEAVARALSRPGLEPDVRLELAKLSIESAESLDHAAVYDASGALIDVVREKEAEQLTAPEQLDESVLSDARQNLRASGGVSRSFAGPRALLVVPIQVEPDAAPTGYVASAVSLAPVQSRVERLASAHFGEEPDALFVVDEQGRYLAHPDHERADSLADATDQGVLAALAGEQGGAAYSRSGEYAGPGGQTYVGTVVGLEAHPWRVVVQRRHDVVYASMVHMRQAVLITVCAAVATALFAGLIFARRITAPLAALTRQVRELAARHFDARVQVETADELAVVGHALNRAAGDLQASEQRILRETEIRSDLGRYLDAELVDAVVRREQDMALGGRRREVTVLFADVVAFTPITENLDPEHVVAMLNELFTIATEIVFRHEGTVDKFIGDCVMAMWGAPRDQPDHAARALSAAEELQSWLEVGNASWQERYGVSVQLAVGVNTGEAVVGNIGSEQRMEYTAIGDVVNVAARLEAIARPGQILITRATRQAAGDDFDYVELGERELSGRRDPVHLFEVAA